MSTGRAGSTGNCWNLYGGVVGDGFTPKNTASPIDLARANFLANSARRTDADGTYHPTDAFIGSWCPWGLGIGSWTAASANCADPDVPGTTLTYAHQYIDTLGGLGSTTDVLDLESLGQANGRIYGRITFNQTIDGAFALIIGAGQHDGLWYDFDGIAQGTVINFDYQDYGQGYQPDDWRNLSRVALYTVNEAGANVPEPGTLLLMALAILAMAAVAKRKPSTCRGKFSK